MQVSHFLLIFYGAVTVAIILLLPSSLGQGQNQSGVGVRTSYKYPDCTDCGVCQERPRPICGTDGVTYFNPCHLGCEKSCNARSKNRGLRPAYEGPCYQEPEPPAPSAPEYEHTPDREQRPPPPQSHNRFHVFRP